MEPRNQPLCWELRVLTTGPPGQSLHTSWFHPLLCGPMATTWVQATVFSSLNYCLGFLPQFHPPSLSSHHSRSGKCTIAVSLSRATETWGHLLVPHISASADDTQLLPAPWMCRSLTLGLSLPLLSESPQPLLAFRSGFNVVFSASPSLSPQTGLCVRLTHSWDSLYCPHQHRLQNRRPRPLRGRHDNFLIHHGRPCGRCCKSLARVNQSLEPESFATLLLRGSHWRQKVVESKLWSDSSWWHSEEKHPWLPNASLSSPWCKFYGLSKPLTLKEWGEL